MTIKAALLDESGVFLRMDELAGEGDLTDRHLPEVTECDLPPGLYRWIPSAELARFPQGGTFVPLRFIEEQEKNARAALRLIDRKRQLLAEEEQGIRMREGL
jgi:hypothetical protein